MVTDEMVEKAARAMCEAWHYSKIGTPDGDAEWRKKQGQYRKQARAALEAALSAAEPAAYVSESGAFCAADYYGRIDAEFRVFWRPLYVAPPAPSVAVKALEEVDRLAEAGLCASSFSGSRAFHEDIRAKVNSALSAQVQDVSGWKPIETAPKDGSPILAYNPVMGVYNTAYQLREDDERDRWPCGFSGYLGKWYCWPTHWMPLPAAPAKQEGGHD